MTRTPVRCWKALKRAKLPTEPRSLHRRRLAPSIYPDEEMRLAISRCVALETSRGWRIAKERASHRIDVIVALAQAALGAVKGGQGGLSDAMLEYYAREIAQSARPDDSGLCANLNCKNGPGGTRAPIGDTWTQARGLKFCGQMCAL